MATPKHEFKRVMLKLSGEALGGKKGEGLDPATLERISEEIGDIVDSDFELSIVVGAGNFVRGRDLIKNGIGQVGADQMGMIATLINAHALSLWLLRRGITSIVLSPPQIKAFCEEYDPLSAQDVLDQGMVTICAGGTGSPFFTTDTAAVLRALEQECDVMLKATMVDGVYDKDPVKFSDAVKFDTMTYDEYISRKLEVMDLTAVSLARSKSLPIVVFNMSTKGMLAKVVAGDLKKATLIADMP
jgi:uridylate kinase